MKRLITLILTLIMLYAIALADEPATTMIGAANVPSIPAGTLSASLVSFTSNQTYPVYSAPDSKSIRGAKSRARVSINGWIQVFGSEGDWILVQYDITDTHNRIGYIYKNAACRCHGAGADAHEHPLRRALRCGGDGRSAGQPHAPRPADGEHEGDLHGYHGRMDVH